MKRTCKQCGKEFIITQSEINFYKSKNLSIPKRCKECRQSNKQNKGSAQSSPIERDKTRVQKPSQPSVRSEVSNAPKTKNSPVTKIVTGVLIVLALIYSIFFGGNSTGNQATSPATDSVGIVETKQGALSFRNEQMRNEHYEKHGIEMGFSSAAAYEDAAEAVVQNSSALHKIEAEDGDDVYYLEASNEFVVVSKDGYIRTYFCPEDGIDYYNRQ